MSIALETKVTALSDALRQALETCAQMADTCSQLARESAKLEQRVAILEQTAQRKPGPKPKDQA